MRIVCLCVRVCFAEFCKAESNLFCGKAKKKKFRNNRHKANAALRIGKLQKYFIIRFNCVALRNSLIIKKSLCTVYTASNGKTYGPTQ